LKACGASSTYFYWFQKIIYDSRNNS
jgi:hypothetical protein